MSGKVFVAGAGGYIGLDVALGFRRAGYEVFGLIRNEKNRKELEKNEIVVVLGELSNPAAYASILEQCSVVIDAIGINEHSTTFFNAVVEAHKNTSPVHNFRPLFVFTSGILIYGPNVANTVVDETMVPNPLPEVVPRKKFEEKVLQSESVRGVVIRPGFVYGGSGGHVATSKYFAVKPGQDLAIVGSRTKRWSWVHIHDLAEAYVAVAKAGRNVDGQVFNIASYHAPTYEELMAAGAKAVGWAGETKYLELPTNNLVLRIYEAHVVVNPQKAMDLLGWRPKHKGLLEEIDKYFKSWQLHQEDGSGH